MPVFSLCVYCGSRPGRDPAHEKAATALGEAIAGNGWRLVFGAGDIGLMGSLARAAQLGGADTLGVIPTHLLGREMTATERSRVIITENMHERKKVMFMNSDAVVVMPGGAGSLDEFFEVLTWAQLGLHTKPIFLLNTNGYWDKLTSLIDHVIAEGFADEALTRHFKLAPDVASIVAALAAA